MSRPLVVAVVLSLLAGNLYASSFVATTDTLGRALVASVDAVSDLSSSFNDNKIVSAARDDAASFVASAGALRGVRLEAALGHIRQQLPQLRANDMQLAEAILSL